MSAEKRRRANALEDFQTPDFSTGTPPQRGKPADPATAALIPAGTKRVERIERLRPSEMIPDQFQPRRLLPNALRAAFFGGLLDCYETARRWLELAEQDPLYRASLERLLQMGSSFETHGQIKPITGAWQKQSDGRLLFQIETGERRFWASCLRHVSEGGATEPLLRVEVIEKPTRQRQVLENRHAEAPSAVSQACEVAALILAELDQQPNANFKDEYEFFRQARSQRMPPGTWDKLIPLMQLTRPRMVQLLNILRLPTPLLEMADHYRLSERVLREILALPKAQWEEMIRLSGQEALTSEEIQLLRQPEREQAGTETGVTTPLKLDERTKAFRNIRLFQRTLSGMSARERGKALDAIANDLMVTGDAPYVLSMLEELVRLLQVRANSKV